MTDLDLAAAIIDDARHALSPEKPGPRIEPAKRVLWSEDASRIVREWQDRKRKAADPTPAHVRHHEGEARRSTEPDLRIEVQINPALTIDLDDSDTEPTVRVWKCTVCRKREPWGPGWAWFGSWRQLDLTGEPEFVACSPECRQKSARSRKLNPGLVDA